MGEQITTLLMIRRAFGDIAVQYDLREMDVERIFYSAIEEFFKTKDYWLDGNGLNIQSHTIIRKLNGKIQNDIFENKREISANFLNRLKNIPNLEHQEVIYNDYLLYGEDEAIKTIEGGSFMVYGKAQSHLGYKNLTKKEFREFYNFFMMLIKREHKFRILEYIKGIIKKNNGVLFCEMIRFDQNDAYYTVKPFLKKDEPLNELIVTIKLNYNRDGESVLFPQRVKRVPVEIIDEITSNKNAFSDKNIFKAKGFLMSKKVCLKHLEILNKRLLKEYDVDLNLSLVKLNAKGTRLEYTSVYQLPIPIIKSISKYFRSFNVIAFVNDN